MMKYTLITGASSGIGYELAKVFAEHNHNLILVARSADKLNELKVQVLPADLSYEMKMNFPKIYERRSVPILELLQPSEIESAQPSKATICSRLRHSAHNYKALKLHEYFDQI